jgi:hypothetical protein
LSGLVHATFQRGDKSYVLNLNASKLDEMISDILSYNAKHQEEQRDGK